MEKSRRRDGIKSAMLGYGSGLAFDVRKWLYVYNLCVACWYKKMFLRSRVERRNLIGQGLLLGSDFMCIEY